LGPPATTAEQPAGSEPEEERPSGTLEETAPIMWLSVVKVKLVLQRRFGTFSLLSSVMAVPGLRLSPAAVVGPGETEHLRRNGLGYVYQETADLCWAEADQVAAAFGSLAAVTAR
jgi:hypothetical protein